MNISAAVRTSPSTHYRIMLIRFPVAMGGRSMDRDSRFPCFCRTLAVLRTAERRCERKDKEGDDLSV